MSPVQIFDPLKIEWQLINVRLEISNVSFPKTSPIYITHSAFFVIVFGVYILFKARPTLVDLGQN